MLWPRQRQVDAEQTFGAELCRLYCGYGAQAKDSQVKALSSSANGRARAQTELAQFEAFVSFRGNVGKDLTIKRHAAGKEQEAPALTAGIGAAEKP